MQLLHLGAMGLGGGVAGRSLLGLARAQNEDDGPSTGTLGPVRPEIHVPGSAFRDKHSASQQGPPADMVQYLANMLPTISTTRPLGDWWGPTAAVGAAGAGIGGGYALTDWLLKKEREGHRAGEVENAESDYQNALDDEYHAAMMAKQAGDDLGIDALYDAIEKRAADGWGGFGETIVTPYRGLTSHVVVQNSKGWLLASMLATALGSGYAMHNHTMGKSKSKLLAQAMQQRARRRAMLSPAPPVAIVDNGEAERAA